jgi:hypothetical protein
MTYVSSNLIKFKKSYGQKRENFQFKFFTFLPITFLNLIKFDETLLIL